MTQEKLAQVLPEVVRRLREALNPLVIYVYGSCARGTPGPHSDLDLLVIVAESELDFFARSTLAYRALQRVGVPVDVQVYTRQEFESRAALPVSFERTVRTKGQVVYAA